MSPRRNRAVDFSCSLLVLMSNPKALLCLAFIPQFVDPSGNYVGQIGLLGLTAMQTAALTDGAYAILGGRAGHFMSGSASGSHRRLRDYS